MQRLTRGNWGEGGKKKTFARFFFICFLSKKAKDLGYDLVGRGLFNILKKENFGLFHKRGFFFFLNSRKKPKKGAEVQQQRFFKN